MSFVLIPESANSASKKALFYTKQEAEKAAKFVISMDKDNNEALDILKAIEVYKDEPKGKGIYIDFNKKR